MSRQRGDSGRLVTALLSRRISYGYSATAPASSPQPSLLWPRTASPIRCPTVRSSQTPAGSRPSFTIPRLPDIAECIALPVCIVSKGRHSRESGQRRSRPALGIHPRPCREPASPFGGSRRGFPPVNWRDPILGLTELPSLGRVPALTGRRSIERTSLPSAVSFDRPRPDAWWRSGAGCSFSVESSTSGV